jgi:hypothetical protein
MRNLGNGKPHPRRRLLDGELAIAIQRRGTVWPLSADEISEWARRLGGGADNEGRLQNLVTYWFAQASSLIQVSQAAGTMTGVEPAGRRRYKGGEGRPGEGNAGYCDPRIARKPAGRRAGGSAPHEADVKADSVTPASLQRLSPFACLWLPARLRRTWFHPRRRSYALTKLPPSNMIARGGRGKANGATRRGGRSGQADGDILTKAAPGKKSGAPSRNGIVKRGRTVTGELLEIGRRQRFRAAGDARARSARLSRATIRYHRPERVALADQIGGRRWVPFKTWCRTEPVDRTGG